MVESCSTCLHRDKEIDELPCSECQWTVGIDDITRTKYERKIVTNADRIRSMSDEELAEVFVASQANVAEATLERFGIDYNFSEEDIKSAADDFAKWLQQPWEEQ